MNCSKVRMVSTPEMPVIRGPATLLNNDKIGMWKEKIVTNMTAFRKVFVESFTKGMNLIGAKKVKEKEASIGIATTLNDTSGSCNGLGVKATGVRNILVNSTFQCNMEGVDKNPNIDMTMSDALYSTSISPVKAFAIFDGCFSAFSNRSSGYFDYISETDTHDNDTSGSCNGLGVKATGVHNVLVDSTLQCNMEGVDKNPNIDMTMSDALYSTSISPVKAFATFDGCFSAFSNRSSGYFDYISETDTHDNDTSGSCNGVGVKATGVHNVLVDSTLQNEVRALSSINPRENLGNTDGLLRRLVSLIEQFSQADSRLSYAKIMSRDIDPRSDTEEYLSERALHKSCVQKEGFDLLKKDVGLYAVLCVLLGVKEIDKIGIGLGTYMLPATCSMKLHCTTANGNKNVVLLTLKEDGTDYVLHKVVYPRRKAREDILQQQEQKIQGAQKRFIPFMEHTRQNGILEYYAGDAKATFSPSETMQNLYSLHEKRLFSNVKMGTFSLDIPIALSSMHHERFIMPEVVGEDLGNYIDKEILNVTRYADRTVVQEIKDSQEERFTKLLPLGRDILQGILSAKAIERAGIDIKFENCIVAKDTKERMRACIIDTAEMMGQNNMDAQITPITYFPYSSLLRGGFLALKTSNFMNWKPSEIDIRKESSFLHLFDLRAFLVTMLGPLTHDARDIFLGRSYTAQCKAVDCGTDKEAYNKDKAEVKEILKTLCKKQGLSDANAQTVLDFVFIRVPEFGTTPVEQQPYSPKDVKDFLKKEKDILRILPKLFDLNNYEDPQFETALREVARFPIDI